MAKVLYGGGVANMSGSQAGTVHSHNQFGSYTRNRVVPVNPQSARQTLARSRMSYCAQHYRKLTDAQRLDWTALGAQIVRSDPLGQTYTLKGFSAFVLVNCHLLANGVSVAEDAPIMDAAPVVTPGAVTLDDAPDFKVAYTAVGGSASNTFEIWASPPVSQGKSYCNPSAFKKIGKYAGNVATPIDIDVAYEAVFGGVLSSGLGERIFIEFRPFSANGIPGPVSRTDKVLTAGA